VEDITSGAVREVATGRLVELQNIRLQDLPGGASRTYRFTVGFPDSGPYGADNAYAGGSLRMDYEWLVEAIAATPTPAPPAGPAPAPTPPVGAHDPGAPRGNPSLAPRLTLRIPHQRVVHTDYVRVFARCSERCTVRFSGRASTVPQTARVRARMLMRRGLFRGERRARVVRVNRQQAVKLKLSRRGLAVLRGELDRSACAGVVIRATVRGARGTRTVRKRIVLRTTLIRDGRRIRCR
jgi:hypothetical protein